MTEKKETPRLLRGNRIILVVVLCLSFTVFLFWNENRQAAISFEAISWTSNSVFFLLLALLSMAMRDLAYMVRIRVLTEKFLSWKQSFNVIIIWEFASALSPGVVGGTAVAMFILKGEKVPLGRATSLVIITAIMDNLFYIIALPLLFLFISTAYLFPADLEWFSNGGRTLFWIGYGIVLFVTLFLFVSVFFLPSVLSSVITFLIQLPIIRRWKFRGLRTAMEVKFASVELRDKKFSFWLKVFGATIWSWTCRFLVINFLLMAFLELGLIDHLIILGRQMVMWLIMLVTPTPGSSGMAEFLFSKFLSDFIQNGTLALSLAFLWRIFSYYPYLLLGSIVYPRWMRR